MKQRKVKEDWLDGLGKGTKKKGGDKDIFTVDKILQEKGVL